MAFSQYYVSVSALNEYNPKNYVSYGKAGNIPASINLDFTASITNSNIYGLAVQFSNDYT